MPRQITRWEARLEYLPIGASIGLLHSMPRERAVRFGARLGGLAGALDRFNRPVAMRNLAVAFPELSVPARLAILRDSYRNWGRMLGEWVHCDSLEPENIARYVRYENRDYWDTAIATTNGCGFVVTGHFGNFELLSVAHSMYGYRIAIVHRPLRNPLIDAAVNQTRARFGNRSIVRRGAGRTIVGLIREGRWGIAVPLDLDVRRGVFVDFFSCPASTNDGPARLAMMTKLPVVPAFMVREGTSLHHRITVMPPVELVYDGDREETVRENTQRLVRPIENIIRRYPAQWNWIHRRWKTRPPGEPRFY
ncbi:MAG TPA: lysophospholipid acyltransferase family protein [Candidatus Binataceae bacterium]|nr:lysophospholipid acyltransferase family protein [Candidatus Binataceae bacterium]